MPRPGRYIWYYSIARGSVSRFESCTVYVDIEILVTLIVD